MKKEHYKCVRCNYSTPQKSHMRQHFSNIKPCPALLNVIDLTPEIKQFILDNRIYNIPKKITNNINFVQNIITNMDILDKLSNYIEYKNINLVSFEDKVEEKYSVICEKLEDDKYKYGFELKTHDILEVIDTISSIPDNKIEELNIIYDNETNKLRLYECGKWKVVLIEQGIQQIIIIIKDNYLDSYEIYLLRKIKNDPSVFKIQKYKELLVEYYKFLGSFEIEPFCKDRTDSAILNIDDEYSKYSYDFSEDYYSFYKKAMDQLSKSEINKLKKTVLDIVKRNSKQNIGDLNKSVIGLIEMDVDFRNNLLGNVMPPLHSIAML